MSEKFLNLSKGVKALIVTFSWLLTVVAFTGCILLKHYLGEDSYWVQVLLTLVGLFFCVAAICLTILYLTFPKEEKEN